MDPSALLAICAATIEGITGSVLRKFNLRLKIKFIFSEREREWRGRCMRKKGEEQQFFRGRKERE
jgi:hypothetical protein